MALQAKLIGPDDMLLLRKGVEVLHAQWPYVDPKQNGNDRDNSVTAPSIMKNIKQKPEGYSEFAIVVGENLDDPKTRKVTGFSNGLFLEDSGTAIITYMFAAPGVDPKGPEDKLTAKTFTELAKIAKAQGRELNAVFIELQKPETAEDEASAQQARELLKHYTGEMGAREVGTVLGGARLAYANPHWDNDLEYYSIPDNRGKYATAKDVRGSIEDLHNHWFEAHMVNKPGYPEMRAEMTRQLDVLESRPLPAPRPAPGPA